MYLITINTNVTQAGTYNIASAGGFVELDIPSDEYTMMSSNEPILLAQFTKTQLSNNADLDKGEKITDMYSNIFLIYPQAAMMLTYNALLKATEFIQWNTRQ